MAFLHEGAPCGMSSLRSDTLTMRVTGVRITVFCSAIVIDVIVHCHTAGALFESNGRKQLSLSSCGWVFDPFRPVHNHGPAQGWADTEQACNDPSGYDNKCALQQGLCQVRNGAYAEHIAESAVGCT